MRLHGWWLLQRDDAVPNTESQLTLCAQVGDATPQLSSLSVWSYTLVVVLLALVPVVLIVRNLRLALSARATRKANAVLRPGAVVLEGTVDHPFDPPLRVAITQTGTRMFQEQGQGRFNWTESGRSVHAVPFRLRLPSEQVVEVVPDDQVGLLLDMDRTEQESARVRQRIAEVRDGDRLFISGRLDVRTEQDPSAGGYRGGVTKKKFSLRPAGAGGMLVSKGPLDDVFKRPIRHHVGALLLLTIVMALIHLLFVGYHARTHSGVVLPGEIMGKRIILDPDDRNNTRFALDLRMPEQRALRTDVTQACYERVEEGDHVPILVSPNAPDLWQVGSAPSVNLVGVFGGFLVLAGGLVGYILILRASRRWYGGRLLDETSEASESGAGSG